MVAGPDHGDPAPHLVGHGEGKAVRFAAAGEHALDVLDVDPRFGGEVLHQHPGEETQIVDPLGALDHELRARLLRHGQKRHRLAV
ncbi:MAG TPA: hypothetical protein VFA79_14450, partial [Myxococcales bacterium]|nr:hypothetical protein [Myxococcales bacterium]